MPSKDCPNTYITYAPAYNSGASDGTTSGGWSLRAADLAFGVYRLSMISSSLRSICAAWLPAFVLCVWRPISPPKRRTQS